METNTTNGVKTTNECGRTPGPWVTIPWEPWTIESGRYIIAKVGVDDDVIDVGGVPVTEKTRAIEKANADFIVRACNAHDGLLAALQGLMWRFDDDDSDVNAPQEVCPDILAARNTITKTEIK